MMLIGLHRTMRYLGLCLLALCLYALMAAASDAQTTATPNPSADLSEGDVYQSMQWPELKRQYLGGQVVFDARVKVTGPRFAEDAMNVPIAFDASALQAEGIRTIVVLVDRNPIRKALEFQPLQVRASLAFRFKLEQASPVRVAVQTRDGVWHVGGTWVEAAGGGCTVPGQTRSDGSWSRTLNQVQAKFFPAILADSHARLRVRIMHPMDTGLVAGIPAFYLEELRLRGGEQDWFVLRSYEPIAENPIFSIDFLQAANQPLTLLGRDNNGNRLQEVLQP